MSTTVAVISGLAGLLALVGLVVAAWAVATSATVKANLEAEEKRSGRLEAEIEDGDRRESRLKSRNTELQTEIGVLNEGWKAARERLKIVEDVLTKRVTDDEVALELAALKATVDSTVTATLKRIETKLDKWQREDGTQ